MFILAYVPKTVKMSGAVCQVLPFAQFHPSSNVHRRAHVLPDSEPSIIVSFILSILLFIFDTILPWSWASSPARGLNTTVPQIYFPFMELASLHADLVQTCRSAVSYDIDVSFEVTKGHVSLYTDDFMMDDSIVRRDGRDGRSVAAFFGNNRITQALLRSFCFTVFLGLLDKHSKHRLLPSLHLWSLYKVQCQQIANPLLKLHSLCSLLSSGWPRPIMIELLFYSRMQNVQSAVDKFHGIR